MIVYIIIFIGITLLSINYEFSNSKNNNFLGILAITLAILAGFRHPSIVMDYQNYQYAFEVLYKENNLVVFALFEPGFILIVNLVRFFIISNYAVVIMLVFSISSVFCKIKGIQALSINPYLVALFYYSHFFFLQEMTQIRIGLASAIFFISIDYYLKEKNKIFISLILLATLFHYSAILYLGLLFFNKEKFNHIKYVAIIIISLVLSIIRLPLTGVLNFIAANDWSPKFDSYASAAEHSTDKVNVFNVITILNIICCLYFLLVIKKSEIIKDQKLILFLKCTIISIFLLSLLSGVSSIAFRMSDLFAILSMFTFAYLSKYLPFGKYNIFITIILAGIFFYNFALKGDLIKPYKFVDIIF